MNIQQRRGKSKCVYVMVHYFQVLGGLLSRLALSFRRRCKSMLKIRSLADGGNWFLYKTHLDSFYYSSPLAFSLTRSTNVDCV